MSTSITQPDGKKLDLALAKKYFDIYWSVGELRAAADLYRLHGYRYPTLAIFVLVEQGYIIPSHGVLNRAGKTYEQMQTGRSKYNKSGTAVQEPSQPKKTEEHKNA